MNVTRNFRITMLQAFRPNRTAGHATAQAKKYVVYPDKIDFIFSRYRRLPGFNINYCNHHNVTKCDQYSPFKNKNFINGYKNTKITKYISIWQINGSILSKFFGKLISQIRLIDSALPPEGEKASFENLLVKTHKDIKSNNFDLIFVHTLVPHTPYGYNDKCIYNGELKNLNTFYQRYLKLYLFSSNFMLNSKQLINY